jgi:hypothetical protein
MRVQVIHGNCIGKRKKRVRKEDNGKSEEERKREKVEKTLLKGQCHEMESPMEK